MWLQSRNFNWFLPSQFFIFIDYAVIKNLFLLHVKLIRATTIIDRFRDSYEKILITTHDLRKCCSRCWPRMDQDLCRSIRHKFRHESWSSSLTMLGSASSVQRNLMFFQPWQLRKDLMTNLRKCCSRCWPRTDQDSVHDRLVFCNFKNLEPPSLKNLSQQFHLNCSEFNDLGFCIKYSRNLMFFSETWLVSKLMSNGST